MFVFRVTLTIFAKLAWQKETNVQYITDVTASCEETALICASAEVMENKANLGDKARITVIQVNSLELLGMPVPA